MNKKLNLKVISVILAFAIGLVSLGACNDDLLYAATKKTAVTSANKLAVPDDLGKHYAFSVIDAYTGETILSSKASKKVYPASTTKLMTAIVLTENASDSKVIKVTNKMLKKVSSDSSKYGLKAGEKYTLGTLLNMILICSAGDAAVVAAIGVFGSIGDCVEAMNQKAQEMGLTNTSFDNVIGLDVGNDYDKTYTTAGEMALITREAMNIKRISKIVKRKTYQVKTANGKKGRKIQSTNLFYSTVSYNQDMYTIIGSKTGTTNAAGHVFTATATDLDGRKIIVTYMGKESTVRTFKDIKKLLNTVFEACLDGTISVSTGNQTLDTSVDSYIGPFVSGKQIDLQPLLIDDESGQDLGPLGLGGQVTYSSSNPEVLSVDANGLVTILGRGQADIIITISQSKYYKAGQKTLDFTIY